MTLGSGADTMLLKPAAVVEPRARLDRWSPLVRIVHVFATRLAPRYAPRREAWDQNGCRATRRTDYVTSR